MASRAGDSSSIIELYCDEKKLEEDLFVYLNQRSIQTVNKINWIEVGDKVYRKKILQDSKNCKACFDLNVSIHKFVRVMNDFNLFPRPRTRNKKKAEIAGMVFVDKVTSVICALIGSALIISGWSVGFSPGESFYFVKDKLKLNLFERIEKLARGEITFDAWERECMDLGISEIKMSILNRHDKDRLLLS